MVTRFDASTGTSVTCESGTRVEHQPFSGEELIEFPKPYGEHEVHIVPHPEPVTLPRYIDVGNVVFKVGYQAEETRRIKVLLELGFDSERPFEVDGVAISPRPPVTGTVDADALGLVHRYRDRRRDRR